jgi:hypothetical protein
VHLAFLVSDGEAVSLEVDDVVEDALVVGGGGVGQEIAEGFVIDNNIEGSAILQVVVPLNDCFMHAHGFSFGSTLLTFGGGQ